MIRPAGERSISSSALPPADSGLTKRDKSDNVAMLAQRDVLALPPNQGPGALHDELRMVRSNISLAVSNLLAATCQTEAHSKALRVRDCALDCVIELEQLHFTVLREINVRRRVERELQDTHRELELARLSLAGTQEGEKRARYLAMHDPLTSLPNRSYFLAQLERALNQSEPIQPFAVFYLDLDGFKELNDGYGHDAGDGLLRIVAARLARAARAEDMVSRLGGDEFACLFSGLQSRNQLRQVAGKLFDAVSAPLKFGNVELSVRPSIGIAVFPTDGRTADALLKNADAAMYRAKRNRCGYSFYEGAAARQSIELTFVD